MRITKLSLGLLLLVGLTLAGCSSSEKSAKKDESEANKLTVYTTIYPLQDFAKKIGGEFVEVESIYPPNVDAHSFEPSTKDMMNLAEADLFIYSGAGIEGFTEKAEKALRNEKVMMVKAAENVDMIESGHTHSHDEEESHSDEQHQEGDASHSDEEHKDDAASHSDEEHQDEDASHSDEEQHDQNLDPHVWLDPILSIKLAANIKDSLIELMPDREQEFEQNFALLEKDLKELDNEFKNVIEQAENKHLLVAHEAYGYWSNRYGIIQIAVNGLSPTQEPSQRELTNLIEEAKEHDLKYIAFEQNVSSRVAEMIQREIGAETVTLYNLESISAEDMKNQEDYFSLMRKNLQTLEKVLN
ncbi:zinc ABC transporter substrate-binding protein [Mesobacillus subterraneus]|uniref:metal ABC transporter solute-binding protein, Zn/Mn family n=1 Tax=Mesobacillus subterraneus TaxID=285983 RepID=UPI001CFC8F48|nr:zinc ABC transporter substrate-binding protein [Mesobacillus subterraneus]WLR54767.1 zinc ABC transporter substrate-binding protein [Mesobacillus subterraneus]